MKITSNQGFFPKSAVIDPSSEIEILSPTDFFEFFISKSHKCQLQIPETFLFEEGKFILWFFPHKNAIKLKKSSKLEIKTLFETLNKGLYDLQNEEMLGSLLSPNKHLNDMLLLNSRPEIAIVRTNSFETLFVNPYELRRLLDERIMEIRLIQTIIPSEIVKKNQGIEGKNPWEIEVQKDLETFYCKYTRNFGCGNYLIYRKSIKVKFFFIEKAVFYLKFM